MNKYSNLGFDIIPAPVVLSKIPRMLHNPIPVVLENLKKYGDPYGVKMQDKMAIVTTRPTIIQHFLQKNHRNYHKSDIQTEKLAMFLGKGLLTLDGKEWLKQRRLIQPGFHRQRIEGIRGKMELSVAQFYEKLFAEKKENGVFNIHSEMMKLAFQIVSSSLFGSSASDKQVAQLRRAIEVSQKSLIKLIRLPFLEWWFKLSGSLQKALDLVNVSSKDLLEIIGNRRSSGANNGDLLDMLIEAKYEDTGKNMTDQQLLFELLILFVAGHETSANSLSWTIYLLAKHPDVLDKLRKEITGGNMDYCHRIINESLRMYPPAWLTDRMAIHEDQVDGIHIPAGSMMVSFIYGTHHHPDFWIDPEKFNPDRFATDKERAPFTFLPFGGGPRLCIGMQFAMMEMEIALTQFVQKFDFELADGDHIEMKPMVTLGPRGPINMKLKTR